MQNKDINIAEFDKEKDYLSKEILSNEEELIAQKKDPNIIFAKNHYWTQFSKLPEEQITQKSLQLNKSFSDFFSYVHGSSSDTKNDYIASYFNVFEYVFSTLSPEFQRADMQKILGILNENTKKLTTDDGNYQNVYSGRGLISCQNDLNSIFEVFKNKILLDPKYEHVFEDIRKTSTPEQTKNIIQIILHNMPIDISKQWLDILWSKEEQSLNYIKLKPIAEKNSQAFSYLVRTFKGWSKKENLATFFQVGYLGQNNIEELEKNIGKIASQVAKEPVDTLLKRSDLSDSRKIEILQFLFSDLSTNLKVFDFLSEYLINESKNKDSFEAIPFSFSESIKKNLKNLEIFENFYPQLNRLIKFGIVKNEELEGISDLLINIKPAQLIKIKAESLILIAQLSQDKINQEQKHAILNNLYDYANSKDNQINQEKPFLLLFKHWEQDLDVKKLSQDFIEKIKSNPVSETLMKNFSTLSTLLGKEFKDALFFKNYENNDIIISSNFNHTNTTLWYETAVENNKIWEIFENIFNFKKINATENSITATEQQFQAFSDCIRYLSSNKPDKKFNLKENNPVVKVIENITDYLQYRINERSIDFNDSQKYSFTNQINNLKSPLDKLINELFQSKLNNYLSKDNVSIKDALKKLEELANISSGSLSSIVIDKRESFSFSSFFKPKENIELPSTLIIRDKEVIFSTDLVDNETNENKLNKSEFIAKAQKEYSQIKKFLSSVQEKPLNLEVKIKSNNLMLDYVNFVTLIDSAKGIVDVKDLHFLENNLGSYLLESLRSYTKNVDRHDIMQKANDSGNFKKLFSGRSEEDIQKLKDKSDNECLRWIKLLEEQLELVKKNVIDQLNDDSVNDMKVRSKFFTARFPDSSVEFPEEKFSAIKIR